MIPLTVPEVRRLVLAMGEAAERRPFRLAWSRWRRVHQAVAARDHRIVLGGILWVVRSGASWRAMPGEYGKWETAYKRYRLWRATGLWQRILAALPEGASQASL